MPHIVFAGLIAVDFTFELSEFPDEGSKTRAAGARMVPGGGALIAASAAAALGATASLVGAVGDDTLGVFLRDALAARGIDDTGVQTLPGVVTSHSAVLVTAAGERTVINHRDAALFAGSAMAAAPSAFDGVLVDTRGPEDVTGLLSAARALGKPGVVDGEAPVRPAESALRAASHVVFSEQGLRDFTGAANAAALAAVAGDLGVFVAVTRGARPVLCHGPEGAFAVPGFAIDPVDTLGAGDVWHGAFTLALAEGRGARDAVRRANAAAAVKVSRQAGAMPDVTAVAALLR